MKPEDFLKTTLTDIKVKLDGEFKKNFTKHSFFGDRWKRPRMRNTRGALLGQGTLMNSLQSELTPNGIRYSSSVPYAQIHNEGGEIVVTAKMKRYFWRMYYLCTNADKQKNLTKEAQQWKALALKKVGSKIVIPKRQFIGQHPKVDTMIKEIINHNLKEIEIKPFN